MDHKKTSLAVALIPAIAALGIMYKMNMDHQDALSGRESSIESLKSTLERQKDRIESVNQLCKNDVDCPKLIINRFDEMKDRIESLSSAIQDKDQKINHLSNVSDKKESDINALEAELRKVNDTLKVTRQTVDAQISVELEEVEEQIAVIRQDYEKVISDLQDQLQNVRTEAQDSVQEKEEKFRELHKKSINNLLGMVDSLAHERESRIIPLVSTYNDEEVKNRFICSSDRDLSPTEMIFSRHMDKHWLTWPVTVITNRQEALEAETEHGYALEISWENSENMYELSPGDDITIQFQPQEDQHCDSPIQGRRAVFTTH